MPLRHHAPAAPPQAAFTPCYYVRSPKPRTLSPLPSRPPRRQHCPTALPARTLTPLPSCHLSGSHAPSRRYLAVNDQTRTQTSKMFLVKHAIKYWWVQPLDAWAWPSEIVQRAWTRKLLEAGRHGSATALCFPSSVTDLQIHVLLSGGPARAWDMIWLIMILQHHSLQFSTSRPLCSGTVSSTSSANSANTTKRHLAFTELQIKSHKNSNRNKYTKIIKNIPLKKNAKYWGMVQISARSAETCSSTRC